LEVYDQVIGMGSSGAEVVLLGFLLLLIGLLHKSETFERLVGSRVRALSLTYGAYTLPLILLLLRTRSSPRGGGGGLLRFGLIAILVIIIVIIVVLALIAFLIYRVLRRRR
jgi:hypothetical protein